jgi:hypothetical protein
MTTIYKKLQDVRVELAAAALKKSGKNKFSGYDYFELGDFIPTAMSLMKKHNLCGIISYGLETASLSIHDTEADGEPVVITTPMSTAALKSCHEVQNLGAVQTYLRRYLWITALELTEHDALDIGADVDDNKTTLPPKTKTPPTKPAAPDDDGDLKTILVSLAALCSRAKVPLMEEKDMQAAAMFYRDLMMAADPINTTPKKVAAALDSKKTQQQALDTITKYYYHCSSKGDAA